MTLVHQLACQENDIWSCCVILIPFCRQVLWHWWEHRLQGSIPAISPSVQPSRPASLDLAISEPPSKSSAQLPKALGFSHLDRTTRSSHIGDMEHGNMAQPGPERYVHGTEILPPPSSSRLRSHAVVPRSRLMLMIHGDTSDLANY